MVMDIDFYIKNVEQKYMAVVSKPGGGRGSGYIIRF
jgi:hypothetical protein